MKSGVQKKTEAAQRCIFDVVRWKIAAAKCNAQTQIIQELY